MELTHCQKREFYKNGYLKIPGAVPRLMVNAARHTINYTIGQGEKNPFPELSRAAVITDLFNKTPIFSLLESALGTGNLCPCKNGSITLKYPMPVGAPINESHQILTKAIGWGRGGGHLDGLKAVGDRLRGLKKDGTYNRGFTAFAVVYLNKVPKPYCGNFTVWPESHRVFEQHFIEHGHEILDDHMPHVVMPEPPIHITGDPGDVVLAHHQLVHTGAPNISSNIRYAVIFRSKGILCEEVGFDAFTDIWKEWDGIREVIHKARSN